MRAVTRGFAALTLGGALAVSGAPLALAAPCPAGTYPPGQSCVTNGGTTSGQVRSGTQAGNSSTLSTPAPVASPNATPNIVVGGAQPVTAPSATPAPAAGGTGTQAGTTTEKSSLSDNAGWLTAAVVGALALGGLLLFVLRRRRDDEDDAEQLA